MLKKEWTIALAIMAFLVLVPLTSASANVAPSPAIVWFTFEYTIPQQPTIESVKIFICENGTSSSCTQLDHLNDWDIRCAANWCRWEYYPPVSFFGENSVDKNPPRFQLQIRFSDVERISNMAGPLPAAYGDVASYQVTVNDYDMILTLGNTIPDPGLPKSFDSFILTLILEPIVMAIVLAVWLKPKFADVIKFWGLALLVNMVSYPMLWSYFPSIAKYHVLSAETWGSTTLIGGILFSFLFVLILNVRGKGWRIALIVTTVVLLLVYSVLCLFANAMAFNTWFVVEGLSFQNAILLLELSAIVYEGLLFYGLNKRKAPLLPVLAGSLAMNLVSFLVGLLIYNPWA